MQNDQSAYTFFLQQKQLFLSSESMRNAIFTHAPSVLSRVCQKLLARPEILGDYLNSLNVNIQLSLGMRDFAVKNAVSNWANEKKLRDFRQKFFVTGPKRYPVIFHNLAGNLFVSGWESIMQGVLCGGVNIVRPSSRDSESHKFLADLINAEFVKSGVNLSPVHVIKWDHEDDEKYKTFANSIDAAIIFGSDDTVINLTKFFSQIPVVIKHGHATSLALIDEGDGIRDSEHLMRKIALDFSIYDQAGCLSPRALFIRSDSGELGSQLAEKITTQMSLISNTLDRYPLNPYELSLVGNYFSEMENLAILEDGCQIFSSRSDSFIVIRRKLENTQLWNPAPPFRTVEIYDFCKWETFHSRLAETKQIATIGFAGSARSQIEAARLDPSRICPIGEMQTPELNWRHDKTHPMEEIFHWMGSKV